MTKDEETAIRILKETVKQCRATADSIERNVLERKELTYKAKMRFVAEDLEHLVNYIRGGIDFIESNV